MIALEYLRRLPWSPMSVERHGRPTTAELRRWCRAGSVLINGRLVAESDHIPNACDGIWQLIFFPGNRRRQCTMVQDLTGHPETHP